MGKETIVFSVGGSLIVPGKGDGTPDATFLKAFRAFIETGVARGTRFVCIAGGGKTARLYQSGLREVGVSPDDLDWIGIYATHFNAHLLQLALKEYADERLITNPNEIPETDKPVIVGSGYQPGSSTDLRAVQIASKLGAQKVINLSNIDYAYTTDPNIDPNAQKIETMGWDEFIALFPATWTPGLNLPFDPIASREARAAGIEVAVINGSNLGEVEKYLSGEPFIGSVIK